MQATERADFEGFHVYRGARANLHRSLGDRFVFARIEHEPMVPESAIDTTTGAVTHYYGEAMEVALSGTARPRKFWFKKKTRAFRGVEIGPARVQRVRDSDEQPYIPAVGSLILGEVAEEVQAVSTISSDESSRYRRVGNRRYYFKWWHGPAAPVFRLVEVLRAGSGSESLETIKKSLSLPWQDRGREDLWALVKLVLLGDVATFVKQSHGTLPEEECLQISGDALEFAREVARVYQDDELARDLVRCESALFPCIPTAPQQVEAPDPLSKVARRLTQTFETRPRRHLSSPSSQGPPPCSPAKSPSLFSPLPMASLRYQEGMGSHVYVTEFGPFRR